MQSRQRADQIIARAVHKNTERKVRQIAATLEGEVSRTVAGVFRDLVPLLAQERDLASQRPILGLSRWQPLSLPYIKRKGLIAWFAYTSLRTGRTHPRRDTETPLLDTLRGMSGTRIFGQSSVEIRDWRNFPVKRARSQPPADWRAVRFTLLIRPYPKLRSKTYLSNIELWLATQGALPGLTFDKLTNPRGVQRPLLRPWLAWFSDVTIPGVIEAALKARFHDVTIRLRKSWDQGPF